MAFIHFISSHLISFDVSRCRIPFVLLISLGEWDCVSSFICRKVWKVKLNLPQKIFSSITEKILQFPRNVNVEISQVQRLSTMLDFYSECGKLSHNSSPIKFSRKTRTSNSKPHPNRFIFNLILWPREQLNFGKTTRNHFVQLKPFISFQKLVQFDWNGEKKKNVSIK